MQAASRRRFAIRLTDAMKAAVLTGVAWSSFALTGCTFSVDEPTKPVASNSESQGEKVEVKAGTRDRTPEDAAPPATSEKPANNSESPAAAPPKPASAGEKKSPLLQIESTSRRAVDRASGIEPITFDELNLGMQADMVFRDFLLTDRVRELDGKKIRLIGYMDGGVSQTKGLKEFVLLKNTECKFGPGGQADHLVRVLMKGDASADYSLNALQIEGTLKISPFNGPDGNTWSVYDIEGESVKVIRAR